MATASRPVPIGPAPHRRTGSVQVDGGWLQRQLDLRLLSLCAFAREVPCDTATVRKALAGGPISRRKAGDIAQALRRLPAPDDGVLEALLGHPPSV